MRGSGSFAITHAFLDNASIADADEAAARLIGEAPNDDAGNHRLTDLATAAFALHRWSIGIHVGREIRRRRFAKGDRQCRFWALREVVGWSPLCDPQRQWPPPEIRAELVSLLDMTALILFALDGYGWRGNQAVDALADQVIEAINWPWRIVRR